MARKTIASRITNSEHLAMDLEGFAGKLTAALGARFGGVAATQELPVPDQRPTLELFALALREARDELMRRDEEHGEVVRQGRAVRQRRDRLAKELGSRLSRLRSGLRARLGQSEAERMLGLRGRTSQDPLVLYRRARFADAQLTEASLSGENHLGAGLMQLRREIQMQMEALKQAIHESSRAKVQEDDASMRRQEATSNLDAVYQPARRYLLSLGELARVPEVAHLLKLRATKVGRPRKKKKKAKPSSETRPVPLLGSESASAKADAEADVLSFPPRLLPRPLEQGILPPQL